MPYIQVKTSNAFGFMPVLSPGTLARVSPYTASSSEGFIAAGDVVVLSTLAAAGAALPLVRGITAAAGVYSSGILGVAAHCLLSDQASTAVSLTNLTSGILLVFDDPSYQYVVSDMGSSVGGGIGTSGVGYGTNVLATGGLGSTGPFQSGALNGRSNQVISGILSSVTSVVGPFKLVGLHPVDNATSSNIAMGRKWIVAMNNATFAPGIFAATT